MKNRISPFGLTLLVLGIVLILKQVGEINTQILKIYGNMLLFYGIVSVFISFKRSNSGGLFLGSLAFMIGTLLFILSNYDIMSTNKIILPALFYIISVPFCFLFIDNSNQKIFLYLALFMGLCGTGALVFYDSFEWIRFSASISRTVFNLWPYLLIIIGIGVLTDRRV